jgi:hypothetical protein
MMDKDRVVKTLSGVIQFVESRGYGGVAQALHDAVELLNEEPVLPYLQLMHGTGLRYYACGNCRKALHKDDNYCPRCGKKVKWE